MFFIRYMLLLLFSETYTKLVCLFAGAKGVNIGSASAVTQYVATSDLPDVVAASLGINCHCQC